MKKMSLVVEDLTVESFPTTEETDASQRGTVRALQLLPRTMTHHCDAMCSDPMSCAASACDTCADTCAQTCAQTCPISCVNTACVAFCGGGGGDISAAQTCAGCGDGDGWGTYTAVSPCNQTA